MISTTTPKYFPSVLVSHYHLTKHKEIKAQRGSVAQSKWNVQPVLSNLKCTQIQLLVLDARSAFHYVCGLLHALSLGLSTNVEGSWMQRNALSQHHLTPYSSFLFGLSCEKRSFPDILPNHNVAFGLILTLFSHLNGIICDYGFLKKTIKIIIKLICYCANFQKKIIPKTNVN